MAEIFNFNVQDNRSIQFPKANLLEPIMQEDHNVAVWRFRIPKVLNDIDMSGYAWWFVYVNARGQEFSELLTLVDDIDEPDSFCTADYSIDYGISKNPGEFTFALEADNVDGGGEILNEWHTKTYKHKVDKTLQGNHAEFAETESDIISALIIEVQNKVSQLVGGATPEPVSLIADMTDTKKVYLYVGSETGESTNYWYYYNGSAWVAGGLYASGITVDAVPTQGSSNAVSSGGVYEALEDKADKDNTPNIKMVEEDDADLYVADSQGNVIVQFANGHIKTKYFDSSVIKPTGSIEWKFSGSDLLLAYGYNNTVDAVVVLNEGRANGLFDFAKLCTKPKGTDLSDLETADLTVVWNSGTDMHAPFQFLAVNNADGYHADATSPSWVGGNHTLDQMGAEWKTASSKFVHYFADGNEVASGNGKCNHFEIKWANGVQAYNTAKQGGGRECLTEYHDMIFDGVRFSEVIRLVPSEDIKMKLWYGLQFVSWAGKYTNIVFEDATNRQTFVSTDSDIASGNPVTSGILAWGDDDAIEITIDTAFDLGKREYYNGSQGAFTTGSNKGYFTVIGTSNMVNMSADTNWFLRGSYRFFSA